MTICLDGWDVDALLSGRQLVDPPESVLPLRLLTIEIFRRLDRTGKKELVPFDYQMSPERVAALCLPGSGLAKCQHAHQVSLFITQRPRLVYIQ